MTQLTADFELGTNGNDILTTDPGSATAWNVRTVSGGTVKYSNAQIAHGALSAAFDHSGSGSNKDLAWTTAFGTVTDHYGRFYLYVTAYPGSNTPVWAAQDFNVTNQTQIRLKTDGKLDTLDKPGVVIFTTTNSIPTATWVRIEYHVVHSSTVGQVELKLFNTMDSATPTETQTSAANRDTGPNANSVRYGAIAATSGSWIEYLDEIIANAASYPGPVSVPSTVAVVNSGGSSLSNLDRELFNTTGPNRQDSFSPTPASSPQQKVGQPRGIPRQNLDW